MNCKYTYECKILYDRKKNSVSDGYEMKITVILCVKLYVECNAVFLDHRHFFILTLNWRGGAPDWYVPGLLLQEEKLFYYLAF